MKHLLFSCLLLAACQSKNKQESKASITINGKQYTDSVAVDSAGNKVEVKPGNGRSSATVLGSGNQISQ